jgi:CheY-like chemotaxis protein
MDVQMPDLDGLQAAVRIGIREKGSGLHVPIFAMTAPAAESEGKRCMEAGMDSYVAKPVHVSELRRRQRFFQLRQSGLGSPPVAGSALLFQG